MEAFPKEAIKARNLLLIMFAFVLSLDALTIFLDQKTIGISRFIITAILMWFVIQGSKWAKSATIILFIFAVLLALILGLFFMSKSFIVGLIVIFYGAILSIIPAFLIRSKNLEIYFSTKRDQKASK